MSYVVFDTETTGLPGTRQCPTSDNVYHWDKCRILSIAAIKYSSRGRELSRLYSIIKPDTFKVDATHIHGITEEMAETKGKPFGDVYKEFVSMLHRSDILVAHNIRFDWDVLKAECLRRNIDFSPVENMKPVCTLDLVKKWYGKPMKLVILYKELFGKEFDGAHNALEDAKACAEVYSVLKEDPRTYKNIGVKKVIIKASDVAACIGENRYKKIDEVLEDMWMKYSPHTLKGKTRDEYAKEIIYNNHDIHSMFQEIETKRPKNSSEVVKITDAISERLMRNTHLTTNELYRVKDFFKKTLFTTFGTRNEMVTADADDAELHEDETFYSHEVCTIAGTSYQIVGRIDRFEYDENKNKILVEIKNRTRGLFNTIRDYEAIQIHTYLQMTGLKTARLIEQYNDERKSYLLFRDDDLWKNKIVPPLEQFCKMFHGNLSSHL
ncbi:hypothetical protein [Dishui Lake phycodnavirus 4]|nr:hypothetical protein [Dishui Lake phycodnavirus 4]